MRATPPTVSPESAAFSRNSAFQRGIGGLFEYSRRALMLVWTTSRLLCIVMAALTVIAGVLPAGVAYVGALIVDAVIHAADVHHRTGVTALGRVVTLVAYEALLVACTSLAQRGLSLAQSLLRAQLGQRVNVMILEKALTLDIVQFEDSEFYDKLTRAAPRGVEPPVEPGDAHLRPAAERRFTHFLRHPAGAFLAVGGGAVGACGVAVLSGGSEIFRGSVSFVPLAGARVAHADLSRVGAGAR